MAIGFLYGRPIGALLWAGFLRVTVVHHATFFINSLCHYVGKRPYDSKSSARDSWLVSFFTFGEGYHNYHHTFQWDYRNGIKWFAFDPSKWIIKILSFFGVTYDLKVAPDYMIWKNHLESLKDQLNKHINLSTEKCKNFYNQKINNLYREIDFTISDWTKMELEISKLNNKISIDSIRSKRNKYVLKLKEIKKDLKQITFNIKRNYFISEFAS